MAEKPKYALEYKSEQVELVRATCLYVATKLGDMMDDLLIVGGLVPSLIIDQEHLGAGVDPHVGTMDLDVGLQVALLNEGRYRQLTERLRDAEPLNPEPHLLIAVLSLRAGDIATARAAAAEVGRIAPNHPALRKLMGEIQQASR